MAQKTNIQTHVIELDNGKSLTFEVERQDYIDFVNAAPKNSFNAMQNLLASTVAADDSATLKDLLGNPANVPELAGALIEQYKPDVSVAVKKRKASLTA